MQLWKTFASKKCHFWGETKSKEKNSKKLLNPFYVRHAFEVTQIQGNSFYCNYNKYITQILKYNNFVYNFVFTILFSDDILLNISFVILLVYE